MPPTPLILVTNDDGIRSPGLLAAAEAVVGLGDLLLVAPSTQQTSMSRAIAHDARAGVIERVDVVVGGRAVPGYAVSGSPALVVTHAVLELAERPIGLCVSGINYGENIGGSIAVSGTVGAAMEAADHGIPGIAVSVTVQVSQWRTFAAVDWTGGQALHPAAGGAGAGGRPAGRRVGAQPERAAERHAPTPNCARRRRAASPTTSAAAPTRPGRSNSLTSFPSTWSSTGTAWSQGRTSTRSSGTRWRRSPR